MRYWRENLMALGFFFLILLAIVKAVGTTELMDREGHIVLGIEHDMDSLDRLREQN